MEYTVSLKGKGTRVRKSLDKPILGDYQIALQGLDMWYAWPNITNKNNELKYSVEGAGAVDRTIVIPPGAYDLDEIAEYVQNWIRKKGDGNPFTIGGNTNTLKTYIDVTSDDCVVNMGDSSIKSVLGWNTGNLRKGTHVSKKKLTITDINHIFVHCNVVRGEYANLKGDGNVSRQTVLSSFYPLVSPGYRIIKEPRLYYKQANTVEIKDVEVWLTDQNDNPIDNGDEEIFISLHVIPYWDKRAYNKRKYETRT